MKKILFIAASILAANISFAQQSYDSPDRMNCIKLNLSSLPFSNIGLQYERVIGSKITVALQARIMPKRNLFLSEQIAEASDDSVQVFGRTQLSSIAFTPEFRFYPRQAMKGFYLAPYLRVRNISLDAPYRYTSVSQPNSQDVDINGSFLSIGGGLMIGSHFHIGEAISLDWFIIGLHYMTSSATLDAKFNPKLNPVDLADFKSEAQQLLDDTPFFKNNSVNVSQDGSAASIKTTLGGIGIRGFGINLGYRF